MAALGGTEFYSTAERRGEDLVEVTLLARGHCAVRQRDADRRQVRAAARRLDEGRAEIEEARPFSGVLGARDLAIGAVDQRVSTISEKPAFGNLGGVQLFSHHGLDGISPE